MTTISFSGRHFQRDLILQCVRWYLAYALSYRDIEEMVQELSVSHLEHSCTPSSPVKHAHVPPLPPILHPTGSMPTVSAQVGCGAFHCCREGTQADYQHAQKSAEAWGGRQ